MAQLNDLLVLGKANIKGSIKANSDHDLLCHSNEFTFASPKYSGDIYINYRTASGSTDGAISAYRFYKGNGTNLADIVAACFNGSNLFIINDSSNTSYDAMAYFRNRGNDDWCVRVDSEGYNYGLDVKCAADASHAFSVTGKSRFSNRIYANEWIEFSGATGLYFPGSNCNGLHVMPNTVGSYGPLRVVGSRGGYGGIHCGDDNKGLTIMNLQEDGFFIIIALII